MPFQKGEPSCRLREPTPQQRRQVLTMAGFGIRQSEIAAVLGIDEKTLRKHFRGELDVGATEANMRVVSALYANATKHNNVTAQIWWTKARMGWKEAIEVAHDPANPPLTFEHLRAARAFSEALHAGLVPVIEGSATAASEAAPIDLMAPAVETGSARTCAQSPGELSQARLLDRVREHLATTARLDRMGGAADE